MPVIDHYRVLSVPPTATAAQIKAAYWRLANQHHPDRGGDPALMKAINLAWEHLGRPDRRGAYDRQRQAAAKEAADQAARRKAGRSTTRAYQPEEEDGESPFEPDGDWWDEEAYRRREEARRRASYQAPPHQPPRQQGGQAPPRQQSTQRNTGSQESRQQKSRAPQPVKVAVRKGLILAVVLTALVFYGGMIQEAYRGGTGWYWLAVMLMTGPFWGGVGFICWFLGGILGD